MQSIEEIEGVYLNTVNLHYEKTMKRLKESKMPFTIIRSGSNRKIIHPNGVRRDFYVSKNHLIGVHLVRMVLLDVEKRVLSGEYKIKHNPELVSKRYNISSLYTMFNDRGFRLVTDKYNSVMIGVDINYCYWNVIRNIGAISDDLYHNGLKKGKESAWKQARNCAIGSLNKKTIIQHYDERGVMIKDKTQIIDSPYLGVRYDILIAVYEMAVDIARRLGDKFCYFATDCFYVTPDAVLEVQNYIGEYNLESKIKSEKVESFSRRGNNYILKWRDGREKKAMPYSLNYFNKVTHIDNQPSFDELIKIRNECALIETPAQQ